MENGNRGKGLIPDGQRLRLPEFILIFLDGSVRLPGRVPGVYPRNQNAALGEASCLGVWL